jgi:PIN domain nuclease of toxin-antitoxin system
VSRVLLDTHAFLWFVFDDPRLSATAASAVADGGATKLLGVVSLWEIAIKEQLGKLGLGMPLAAFLAEHVEGRLVELVQVEPAHLVEYSRLPLHHRDPFDRLLVAQARCLGVPVVSADPAFRRYDVEVIW